MPIVCLVTGGTLSDDNFESLSEAVLSQVEAAVEAGVDIIQIREKSLSAGLLFELAERATEAARRGSSKVVVNDRADIALASGAHGVHLTSSSMTAETVRGVFGDGFLIGVSTHRSEEIASAVAGRADYITFSPVFDTPSKREYGPPQGLDRLREAVHLAGVVPVLALGGIGPSNARLCFAAGAKGVAAIGCFSQVESIAAVVAEIKGTTDGF